MIALFLFAATAFAPPATDDLARRFGALESVRDISISPDGRRIAYVTPGPDGASVVMVADLTGGSPNPVIVSERKSGRIQSCGWSSDDRLVCEQFSIERLPGFGLSGVPQLLAVDSDGKNLKSLNMSRRSIVGGSLYAGRILNWGIGDGVITLEQAATGDFGVGLGVVRFDTRNLQARTVENPAANSGGYIVDETSEVRIKRTWLHNGRGLTARNAAFLYRKHGEAEWRRFSEIDENGKGGFIPLAVNADCDCAYALRAQDGRDALFTVKLDGSLQAKVLLSRPDVDMENVVRIGRTEQVKGATYVTDRRQTIYFDPEYKALSAALTKALPGSPLVTIVSASADEKMLLLFASSDVDPGRYYLFDKTGRKLSELLLKRPELAGFQLARVQAVKYRAEDGTMVPAYLTLPSGGATKGVPAIVMPHGGPEARDEWGFDWLAQYFAQRGYAVLQPNFRGSSGYGEQWIADNGFKSWRLAIGDVVAAGKWLVKEGIADPAHLAAFGWSYGGYAALQTTALDPGLFKAVVAVAPVTDLQLLRSEESRYHYSGPVTRYIGDGPEAVAASPTRHAAEFQGPVLMFHGTDDVNVAVGESKAMDEALKKAGKASTLIIYDGLDHQLLDPKARADMLAKSDAFLHASMGF